MSEKPEQYSEHNSHYLALSAVAQYIQTIAGTWDTCSLYQKAVALRTMAQHIDAVTEVLAESLAQELRKINENS